MKERAEVKGNLYAEKIIFWSILIIVSCGFCPGESDGEWNSSFLLVFTIVLRDIYAQKYMLCFSTMCLKIDKITRLF